jgi:ABC-type uncharacterized transport system substrate-binding protein
LMQAFLQRLHELGYSEGANMTFKYRSAEGYPDRLPSLAMELVQDKPDVLRCTLAPSLIRSPRRRGRAT